MTDIEQVTVAGGGVLGSQIAYQCAFKGKMSRSTTSETKL